MKVHLSYISSFCAAIFLIGCSDDVGDLAVDVCGNVSAPSEITEVRVSILDENRDEIRAGVVELLRCPEDEVRQLPRSATFASPVGEAWIVAQGLKDGVEVVRREQRARLDGDDAVFRLALTRDCIGITCSLGQTCLRGKCEITSFDEDPVGCGDGAPGPAPNDGSDAGSFCPGESDENNGGLP